MKQASGGRSSMAVNLSRVLVILWRGVAAISLGVTTGVVLHSAGFAATMIFGTGTTLGIFSYRRIRANFALFLAALSVMFWLALELEKLGQLLTSI